MTKILLIDEHTFAKMRQLQHDLHAGTDRERDFGHRLWLMLNNIEQCGHVLFDTDKNKFITD